MMRVFLALAFALLLSTLAGAAQAANTVFLIVRHAEKAQDDPKDPSLSEIGRARAKRLAQALANFPLQAIYVSQFRRTALTAAPTAKHFGLTPIVSTVQSPVPESSAALVQKIKATHPGNTILVVGHSNTVPELVKALSGIEIKAIDEATEFDRIYLIELVQGAKPRVLSLKY